MTNGLAATSPAPRSTHHGGNSAGPSICWVFPTVDGRWTPLPDHGRVTFGRDPACDVLLDGTEVSRCHAAIERARDGTPVLVDLASRNGCFVDGVRTERASLTDGSVLRVGNWIGLFFQNPPAVAPGRSTFERLTTGLWVGPRLMAALAPARTAAASDLPIVLQGETGTGKERVARAIHQWSGRTGPFVAVNCAALPDTMAEAELFGYRKGAFTGAERASPGWFRSADGGTLLLDELADMPVLLQSKLLRVLEEREVCPLGETRPVPIDVRVLAATQTAIGDAVASRQFRADLAARLEGLTVVLPPLRDRREEVPFLATQLLQEHAGAAAPPSLHPSLVEKLCLHDWPLNVRELVLLVRQWLALHGSEPVLTASALPPRMRRQTSERASLADSGPVADPPASVDLNDPAVLIEAVRSNKGNLARAAASLGISRQRLYRLLEEGQVDVASLRPKSRGGGPSNSGGTDPSPAE